MLNVILTYIIKKEKIKNQKNKIFFSKKNYRNNRNNTHSVLNIKILKYQNGTSKFTLKLLKALKYKGFRR